MSTQNALNRKSESITIDPGASGDSALQFDINSTGEFRIGVDDDASDAFKISQGSALGTTDTFVMTAAGEATLPLNPAFGELASLDASVTGDGTVHTVVFDDTEYFDQNGDFDGTSTFTASVDGIYQFNADIYLNNFDAAHTSAYIELTITGRQYAVGQVDPYAARDAGNDYGIHLCILADMDATDTAVVKVCVTGGTKTIDVNGSDSVFNGYLAC